MNKFVYIVILSLLMVSCNSENDKQATEKSEIDKKLSKYAFENLTADLSALSERDKLLIPVFIDISNIVDKIFLYQVLGPTPLEYDTLSEKHKKFFAINFGPWDRFDENKVFIEGAPTKTKGANFYPKNMTVDEFKQWKDSLKYNPNSFVRRNSDGDLYAIPYHEQFPDLIQLITQKLDQAIQITNDSKFRTFLQYKKEAILNDQYYRVDSAWIKLENNTLDFVFGPIEIYEDQLLAIRADYQSFLLVKDIEWSNRLKKYTKWLKYLQKALPVPEEYRAEEPGLNSEIIASDVIYYGGSGQAGGAFLSINQPITPVINSLYGSKRIIFKNTTTAKFKHILQPIAFQTLEESQYKRVTANAFFTNTLFYEVARGLGITKTIKDGKNVNEALREYNNTIELAKANSLALFLVSKIHSIGEIEEPLINHYITFLADIFRTIRLGDTGAQAKSCVICYNFFKEHGAIKADFKGQFTVDFKKMEEANDLLAGKLIMLQGDGNYEGAKAFVKKYEVIDHELAMAIMNIQKSKIPVDIYFNQGLQQLGL